ncbi:hypothetical protein ACH4FX_37070 [Streptomyces sp. NPDC018019]|uniref:hypothetical protein n=1 Tax=Streptomyces sp. NPDC018019 TaxID=3365030 RepID=UPI003795C113
MALMLFTLTSTPGRAVPMATATARGGAFGTAGESGPGIATPVITKPANGSTVQVGRMFGRINFGGTGEPGATLTLDYRKAGTESWKTLTGFTGLVGPDGTWGVNARFSAGELTAGPFEFRVAEKTEGRERNSSPITLTIELGAQPALFTSPREGSSLSQAFTQLDFAGIGEPGAHVSLTYGPERKPVSVKTGGRVDDTGAWYISTPPQAVPVGTQDIYVAEDVLPGHEDKRTITFITDGDKSQVQWNVSRTTTRARAGDTMNVRGWTNSTPPIGDVEVYLATEGRKFSLGTLPSRKASSSGNSAVFGKDGVGVPVDVPPGMTNLVVSDPRNPSNFDSIPVEILPTLPLELKLTGKNGNRNRFFKGTGQPGAKVQFQKPDGSWANSSGDTDPSSGGKISDAYRLGKWKSSWDWAHLKARQLYPSGETGPVVDVPHAYPAPEVSEVTWSGSQVVVKGTTLGDEDGKGQMQVLGADGKWFDASGYSGSGSFELRIDPGKLGETFKVRFIDDWTGKGTPESGELRHRVPLQLKLTGKNGDTNRTFSGTGQPGTKVQFQKADGSWETADSTTDPSSEGKILDSYRFGKWKSSWDWAHLKARQLYPSGETGPVVDVPLAYPAPEVSEVTWSGSQVVVKGTALGDEDGKGQMQVLGADGKWFDAAGYSGSGSFELRIDPGKLGGTFKVRFIDDWTRKATPSSAAQQNPQPKPEPKPEPEPEPKQSETAADESR